MIKKIGDIYQRKNTVFTRVFSPDLVIGTKAGVQSNELIAVIPAQNQ